MIRDMTDANAPSVSKQVDEIKKKSKKKMRNQSGENNEKQSNIRTLDDGLVVEYLSMGNNDAKVASDGCKVAAFSSLQSFGYLIHSWEKEMMQAIMHFLCRSISNMLACWRMGKLLSLMLVKSLTSSSLVYICKHAHIYTSLEPLNINTNAVSCAD